MVIFQGHGVPGRRGASCRPLQVAIRVPLSNTTMQRQSAQNHPARSDVLRSPRATAEKWAMHVAVQFQIQLEVREKGVVDEEEEDDHERIGL